MAPGSDHGGLTAAASRYVPNPPRTVSVPLAVGAWVNANAFGVVEAAMNKQGDIPMNNEHPPTRSGRSNGPSAPAGCSRRGNAYRSQVR